jgi:hypothetical protein
MPAEAHCQEERGINAERGDNVEKIKLFCLSVRRINYNLFIVDNQKFDFLQLINWFKDVMTE